MARRRVSCDMAQRGRDLAKLFENNSIKLKNQAETHLYQAALAIQAKAVELAPVDTGHLKNSIAIRKKNEGKKVRFEVGSLVVYARIQEFGGYAGKGHKVFIRPQPYLRPALYLNKNLIRQKIEEAWRSMRW
jgi:HK97 gp10 family phage protein